MKLYIKKIEVSVLAKIWNVSAATLMHNDIIHSKGINYVLIKCRKDGSVNYEKAGIYSTKELKNKIIVIL